MDQVEENMDADTPAPLAEKGDGESPKDMDDDWCNAMIEASDTHGVGDEMVTSHQAEEAKPATFDTDELWEDAMIDQASQTSVVSDNPLLWETVQEQYLKEQFMPSTLEKPISVGDKRRDRQ